MARLPIVGQDEDQWGQLLGEFLEVAHNPDGTLKGGEGGGGQIAWGNITGSLANQSDVQDALDGKADVNHMHASAKGCVNHGSAAGATRPTGFSSVEWIGSVEPDNMENGDTWVVTP